MRGLILGVFILLFAELTLGQVAESDSSNAATLYEEARTALPRAEGRDEQRVLLDVFATPVNGAVDALVRRAEPALALFDRASEASHCDWQLPQSKPLAASQMARIHGIDEFVVLRTRLRASREDADGALEDCRRLIVMGRRVEQVASSVRQFQGGHLHNKAIITAGLIAPDVPKERLAMFAADLNRLPAPIAPADVVAAEKPTFLMVHRRLVDDARLRERVSGSTGWSRTWWA